MLTQLFGGSPIPVIVRLAVVSVLVGALMMWLGIDPWDLIEMFQRSLYHLWATGFVGLYRVGRYLATGAAVVLPVWILLRILSFRSEKPRPPRWRPLDGGPAS